MNRRRFLDTLLGAAAGAMVPRAVAAEVFWPPPGSICHTPAPPAVDLVTATSGDALVYEGSHILAYGAMRGIANACPQPLTVRGGGCDNALLAVRQSSADLGGLCCPVAGSPAEGLKSLVVARDIKAVVVHPGNPVGELDMEALHGIASGRIARWSQVGGADAPIALVVRRHCPDYHEPVGALLLRPHRTWSPRTLFVDDELPLVDTVAAFPAAIGLASWVFAKPLVEAGKLKLVSVDGVLPSLDSVQSGRYRLTAPLSVIYSEWKPAMAPLFDFIFTPAGRAIVAQRLVPVSAKEAGYRRG
jgi:phosphate transport system substrate-binding protein